MKPGISRYTTCLTWLFSTLLITAALAVSRAQTVNNQLGPELFVAIRDNDNSGVISILDRGANTEGRNWLGISALMWAAVRDNVPACLSLLQHKANVNAMSPYGGPLEFAEWSGDPNLIGLLLDHGAKFSRTRTDRTTAVATAAAAGHVEILKLLLALKPNINATDSFGMTALAHAAARGQVATSHVLLDAGAETNSVDSAGMTPLMYAAKSGCTAEVALLVERGARVNVRDVAGNTPLILVARYNGSEALGLDLIRHGAVRSAVDQRGRTAAQIAENHGYSALAGAIASGAHKLTQPKMDYSPRRVRDAVVSGLELVENTTRTFSKRGACISCHHQGLGLITTGTVQACGFRTQQDLAESEQKVVLAEPEGAISSLRAMLPHPDQYKRFPTSDMNEACLIFGGACCGLLTHHVGPSEPIVAVATIVARSQMPDGSWKVGMDREPIESSAFTSTAYVIRAISHYLPANFNEEKNQRIARARSWLTVTRAVTNEDKTFKLLAIAWGNGPRSQIVAAATELRSTQRPDGGWAQFSGPNFAGEQFARSDAYATGEALYSLHIGAGIPTTDPAYRRGIEFLLRTQDDDGSWFVNKRAIPANNYFDTGFPHGESQYVSYAATCWSTMALAFYASDHGQTPLARTASAAPLFAPKYHRRAATCLFR